jgi:(p)ppGpp synthase/HD superfamily hydrolase
MLTDRYKAAMQFAATLHDGQTRKGTQVAYLSHLMSVSALVMESDGTEHEAIAALLHDSLEDRGHDYVSAFQVEPRHGRDALKRDIELQFGAEVLAIVRQCTDDEYLPAGRRTEKGTPEEWRARKEAYLAALLQKSDIGALRVSCADKLHNARAILADYEIEGERLWQRFNVKSKQDQLWYYEGLADALTERSLMLGDAGLQRLARQLAATVEAIARHAPEHAQ